MTDTGIPRDDAERMKREAEEVLTNYRRFADDAIEGRAWTYDYVKERDTTTDHTHDPGTAA